MATSRFARRLIGYLGLTILILSVALSASFVGLAQEESEEYAVSLQLVHEGSVAPVALASPNDGSGRLFLVDQVGTIWIISADGQMMAEPFLDVSGQLVELMPDYDERGLLGLAFHPDYANNGRFFVYYTAPLRAEGPAGWDHTNVVAEFHVSADNPDLADNTTGNIIWQLDQPQFNHNAGHIAFGPDGYLYIPIGDGGGANDNEMGHTEGIGNGQDTTNQHGSILRIDVNADSGSYSIPTDNPFVGDDNVADEIYAYGFRNPYHISFDRGGSGMLFAADAGQDIYEEVSVVTAGGNYGWNIKEGTHCFDPAAPETPPAECATTGAAGEPLVDPIIEYSHEDVGIVVVGGYMYRGSAIPDLAEYYVFGDFTSSFDGPPDGVLLWAEAPEEGTMWEWGEIQIAGNENNRLNEYLRAIGEGPDGELYLLTSTTAGPTGNTGKVWKLIPPTETPAEGGEPAATEESGEGATTDGGDGSTTEATPAPDSGGEEPVATEEASG